METAGYDLGIFDQAVRSYAHLQMPVVPLKGPGFNLLGDHFHPVIALLAPLYWLWDDPRMLLAAQGVLFALSTVPICRFAMGRLGRDAGIGVTVAYGLSWGLQGAVAFDFHEIAFAVPLMACVMVRLADERYRAAVLWSLPLLLVKEDMGLAVAAVGGFLLLRRKWRLGLAAGAAGAAGSALAVLVVLPHFSPSGEYRYWNQMGTPPGIAEHPQRLVLLLCVLGVTGFVALRSPLLLIAAPLLLPRLASGVSMQWSTGIVHYNAILMPIVFVAFVDGVRRLRKPLLAHTALVIALGALPFLPFARLVQPGFYSTPAHVQAAQRLMARIPDGAAVAAGNRLVPQLTARCQVTLFADVHHRPVDWVIVDTGRLTGVPAPEDAQKAALRDLPARGYAEVARQDGIVLFRRR
ncbi:DUF2079 domain-containing protein [Actinomadura macrotermitis]|nr:DUF2079 domain-containing protein [Actinomadura macrotermitis]